MAKFSAGGEVKQRWAYPYTLGWVTTRGVIVVSVKWELGWKPNDVA